MYDLHIWHAFFGVAGSNNDINVLNQSPLFMEAIKGEASQFSFLSMVGSTTLDITLLMEFIQNGQPL